MKTMFQNQLPEYFAPWFAPVLSTIALIIGIIILIKFHKHMEKKFKEAKE